VKAPAPSPQAERIFSARRAWIMGVINTTPDSFYPGARVATVAEAVARAEKMIVDAADVIDIGGESTRPGALPVNEDEEIGRVLPVIEKLHSLWPQQLLSVDTRKASVARRALAAGAVMINDISAFSYDPEMPAVIADAHCWVVLMHMQGTPEYMQTSPKYIDVVGEVRAFLEERLATAVKAGVDEDKIILDPGIGFGKTVADNLTLLRGLRKLGAIGRPLLVGVSRKSFLGILGGRLIPAEERLEGSLAAGLWALDNGAHGLRVHDVRSTRQAIEVWSALRSNS